MVDFSKRLSQKSPNKKISPVEIYKDLDRSSEAGPLRQIQEEILTTWFDNYQTKKDVILKLHTGQGKTLVGLLILQSLINQGKGPCLYVCPNIYLVRQTIEQAKKFGIPFCSIGEDKQLPIEFLRGSKILITHVQKLFNGFTKFGLNNESVEVGGVILDDSHACIDSIKDSFTIKIPKSIKLYEELFKLFQESLEAQAIGTYSEIVEGDANAFLNVPYWSWIDKNDSVTSLIAQYREKEEIKYKWPLLKNNLLNCQCFISGGYIEISPYVNPIEQFGSFHEARHRILMSATTMNDSFFIKGLNIDKNAILSPLTIGEERWSGEKMILIPYLINESLNRTSVINTYAMPQPNRNVGIVALTPSFQSTKLYEQQGCTIALAGTIDEEIQKFKKGNCAKPLVIVNRYDGIDLPDATCRILIIDSKPYSESLSDKYEELARKDSNHTNIKIAQKIEQGLGRSVRGEKDYSVIIIIGGDLINFIRNPKTQKFFSPQTRKQIEIGQEIAEIASEDVDPKTTNMMNIVSELIRQCIIHRDANWKQFYEERMNSISYEKSAIDITEALELEKQAELLNNHGQHKDASQLVQKFLDTTQMPLSEQGWYLQMIARFTYHISKIESNQLQVSSFKKNKDILKPHDGFKYKKINLIQSNRISNIKSWIKNLGDHQTLTEKVDEILSLLSFEEAADNFEGGIQELGAALGFESQRPDKENREGPDNLWALAENDYLLIECKNEVDEKRDEISKTETGQMNTNCAWFKNNYPGASFKPIMIISTKNISNLGGFNLDVEILRKGGLKSLKTNFKAFYNELKNHELNDLSNETLQNILSLNKLDNNSIKSYYSEKPYQR
jgi:replicative superfamily II helicase